LLHNAVVLARRGHNLRGLEHIVRARLFHVHVLARLARPHVISVCSVRAGDGDGVDGFVFEQLADVAVVLRRFLVGRGNLFLALVEVNMKIILSCVSSFIFETDSCARSLRVPAYTQLHPRDKQTPENRCNLPAIGSRQKCIDELADEFSICSPEA